MSDAIDPLLTLPFAVDAATVGLPCQPGAWGNPTACRQHEGLPLDEGGRCFWGREPSALERMLSASALLAVPPAPESGVVQKRLGIGDEHVEDVCEVRSLFHAPMPSLLRLARSLDVQVPRRSPGATDRDMKLAFVKKIATAIRDARARHNPLVEIPTGPGRIRTVG